MAPAVPTAEKRPTTVPVRARSASWSLTTTGVTALSTTAGRRKASAVSITISTGPPPRSEGPSISTMVGAARDSNPPAMSSGPSRRAGERRSAALPPSQAPSEMPASTVPMMAVKVSSVTPT